MATALNHVQDMFFGTSDTSSIGLNELYPKTGTCSVYGGVPRYARSSRSGMHLIPTSGELSIDDFHETFIEFDQCCFAIRETRNAVNITSGWVLPNTVWYGSPGTGSTNGTWRQYKWAGYTIKVSGYWSGGAKNRYGQWTRSATFSHFRVDISHAKTAYGVINRYNGSSLGYRDDRGLTADTNFIPSSKTGNKNLTIVCKNKASTW